MTEIRGRETVIPRRCLSRQEAAEYVGLGATKFDELVKEGAMPKPFKIGSRVLWDIRALDAAVDELIDRSAGTAGNLWDEVA